MIYDDSANSVVTEPPEYHPAGHNVPILWQSLRFPRSIFTSHREAPVGNNVDDVIVFHTKKLPEASLPLMIMMMTVVVVVVVMIMTSMQRST